MKELNNEKMINKLSLSFQWKFLSENLLKTYVKTYFYL